MDERKIGKEQLDRIINKISEILEKENLPPNSVKMEFKNLDFVETEDETIGIIACGRCRNGLRCCMSWKQ